MRPIDSSGPRVRSVGIFLLACSRETIFRVMSGESMDLPRELAYLCNIMSRTVSTRSSSLTVTSVAEAPGRLTHIFLCIISKSSSNSREGTEERVEREAGEADREYPWVGRLLAGDSQGSCSEEVLESSSS